MPTTNDLVKKYQQIAQNGKVGASEYLNNMRQNTLNAQQNVLAQKYNDPNNINQQAQYNKIANDLNNINIAQQQYGELAKGLQGQQQQAALQYQQAQKYAPSQLQVMGLGNTGLSETSQVGLMNTYQDILAGSQRQFGSDVNKLYQDLANTQRESDLALQKETMANEQAYKDKVLAGIAQSQTSSELEQYRKLLGDKIDPLTQIQIDKQANIIKQMELEKFNQEFEVDTNFEPVDIANSNQSLLGVKANPGSIDYEMVEHLKRAFAKNPNLIPDGTVIDINDGPGTNKFLVYQGKLYRTNKKVNKEYQGSKLYNKIKNY